MQRKKQTKTGTIYKFYLLNYMLTRDKLTSDKFTIIKKTIFFPYSLKVLVHVLTPRNMENIMESLQR